jgi:cyclase
MPRSQVFQEHDCRGLRTCLRNTNLRPSGLVALALVAALIFLPPPPLCGQNVEVRELAPGVFYYFGDEMQQKPANCVWVVFKDYVLVIDASFPWGAREILAEIAKTTQKPVRFVVDTHYHHDHTFGNCIFADSGAAIICSRECAAELRTKGKGEWDGWKGAGDQSLTNYRLEFPSIVFEDKLVFDDGEHRVELMKLGPAHTIGDAVAYLPKERILVTGDLCVNGNPWGNNVADRDADHDNWIAVLDKLSRWDVDVVVPGHGNLGTADTLREQRDYLADLLSQVRTGIRAGKTVDQLVKEIDLSKHKSYGANTTSNARSIRALYRRFAKPPTPRPQ